ncbi:MAG TPA: hypothetical protein VMV10_24770 [Pirellulales bacterium]|nr:hypothetical protein [Pirellulales bacterium]
MRNCVWLLLALLAAGWGACQWPSAPAKPAATATGGWRRTTDGWERRTVWGPRPARFTPLIHPVTVTAFAALGTLIALISLAPSPPRAGSRAMPAGWHVSPSCSVDRRRPFVERRAALR